MKKSNKLLFSILIFLMVTGLIHVNSHKNIVYAETCNSTDTSAEANTIHVSGYISENTTWTNNYTYVVDGTIIVQQGVKLQIDQGVIVKCTQGTEIIVNGTLSVSGTESDKVVFTSYKDSAYGGSGVTGSYDYWIGITVYSTGEFSGDNVKIRYAGVDYSTYSRHCAIDVEGKLNLTNSEVSNSKNNGIYLNTSFDAEIKNNDIISNQGTGIYINNKGVDANNTMDIENNTISRNRGRGVYIYQTGTGNAVIKGNTVSGNEGSGIYVDIFGTGNFSVQNNNLLNNSESGVYVNLGGLSSSIFTGIAGNTYEGNTMSGVACNGVGIGGSITVDLTLSNAVYCLSYAQVPKGKTLTVQSGTIIKSSSKGSSIEVYGKLNAMGTKDSPIVFTSYKDSAYGGSGVTGSYDYWIGITVYSTGEFSGDNVKIRYAGVDYSTYSRHCAIDVEGKLNLTNSEVSNSKNNGIYLNTSFDAEIKNNDIISNQGTGIYINNKGVDANNTMDIENNTISRNRGRGVYIYQTGTGNAVIKGNTVSGNEGSGIYVDIFGTGNFSVQNNNLLNNSESGVYVNLGGLSSSIFTGIAGNTYEGNTMSGVACNGVGIGGSITVDLTLSNAVYCLSYAQVPKGKTLTVQSGTIIKSSSKGSSIEVYGKLNAMGTKDSPIVFTSYKDSAYGGSGVTGSYDYWIGITVYSTGEFSGDNVKIRYAGVDYSTYSRHCAIDVEGKLNLTNSEVSNSYEYSIFFNTNVQPMLFGNTFAANNIGMYNNKASIIAINAQNNYWNSNSGPSVYDNIKGKWVGDGDKVNEGINYFPWMTRL